MSSGGAREGAGRKKIPALEKKKNYPKIIKFESDADRTEFQLLIKIAKELFKKENNVSKINEPTLILEAMKIYINQFGDIEKINK